MTVPNTHPTAGADTAAPASGSAIRATPLGTHAAIVVASGGRGPATAMVTGELDLACSDALAAALCAALDECAAGVALDLGAVDFFDCAALHALERAREHAARRGRRLTLERSSAAVDLVFELTRPLWSKTAWPVAESGRSQSGGLPGLEESAPSGRDPAPPR